MLAVRPLPFIALMHLAALRDIPFTGETDVLTLDFQIFDPHPSFSLGGTDLGFNGQLAIGTAGGSHAVNIDSTMRAPKWS
jgi:hypothetical protein